MVNALPPAGAGSHAAAIFSNPEVRMSDPVIDAELKAVPPDKASEFVLIEEEAWQERNKGVGHGGALERDHDYMSHVLAAAEECGIKSLAACRLPDLYGDDTLSICTGFRAKARHIAHRLRTRAGLQQKKSLAASPEQNGGRNASSREILKNVSRVKRAAEQGLLIVHVAGKPAYVVMSFEDYLHLRSGSAGVPELLAEPGVQVIDFDPPRITRR
jgi:hypothetical protein